MIKSKLIRFFLFNAIGRSLLVVGAAGLGFLLYMKLSGHLTPGPLSATQLHGQPIAGYSSHAEFEKECKHCHAPMHCITADRCQTCHLEIAQQRAGANGLHGVLPGTARCQTCHIEHRGRDADISHVPLTNIDHSRMTDFDLSRHANTFEGGPMICEDCHTGHRFTADAVDCITCHEGQDVAFVTEHRDEYNDNCASCHDGSDRMIGFEHDQVYALEYAHQQVECESCHVGKMFSGTPANCAGCHEEPELHKGIFGFNCTRCHTAQAWAPAQLTRHPFLMSHGEEGNLPCETCHIDTYTKYPCYSCHDSDEMLAVHLEWDIHAYENCVDCHPTGRGGEGKDMVSTRSPIDLVQSLGAND